MQEQFEDKAQLIYNDTDSFVYEVEHDNIYDWMRANWTHFDTSDSKVSRLKDAQHKKKLGKFKDGLNSQVMLEWIALNPKTYAYKYQTISFENREENEIIEKQKAKGVSMATVKKTLPFKVYKKVIETNEIARRNITNIGSFNQQLFTFTTDKIALNSFYDQMKMIDKINCGPFGFIQK